ncbi:Transient receptor potential channel pyrexia [Folsomia candida]|uniref:Transient receptor potential channel pyrexia n=1 Tax=Folsomia candida TaxID=158441 RepID=A0A226EL07_FOLCA|nr:Transient receptor potential channel pyrexia [Folsomia candida]
MSTTPLTRGDSSQSSTYSTTSSKSSRKKKCYHHRVTIDEDLHKCSIQCVDKYPIHHAARFGNFRKLKELLDDPNCSKCPLEPDECLGRTPLHYACATGNVEKGLICVKLLLDCNKIKTHTNAAEHIKRYVNHLDKFGKSPLHLAAKNEATAIVIELLTNRANFDISSLDGTCALREIYKSTPNAMEEALNQSIGYIETCGRVTLPSDNISIAQDGELFDFTRTPVIGSKMKKEECAAYEESKRCHGDVSKCKRTPETGFLFTVNRKRMEAGQRRQILTNALVQAFLYFKWHKVKWFCFMAIGFHAIWLSLYISTVINVFVLNCPYVVPVSTGETSTPPTTNIPTPCTSSIPLQFSALILLLMSFLVTLKEFFQLLRLRSLYVRFENMGQCLLLGFIFMTVPDIYFHGIIGFGIGSLEYQISAFGIFLAWTLLLCQLAKLPQICIRFNYFGRKGMLIFPDHGIYVEILSRVFKNFLIFITIFSSLLISFVFSFNILLPNSTGFVNLPTTLLKVLTMMTGELNYDEIFHSESELIYPISSHVMYAIFIMVATIILFNLLIGFTVSDIQGLQKDAQINQISNKLEQIFLMECFLLSGMMQRFVRLFGKLVAMDTGKIFDRIMVVKMKNSNVLCYHTTIKALPFALRVKLRHHASKNCMALSDISGTYARQLFSKNVEH